MARIFGDLEKNNQTVQHADGRFWAKIIICPKSTQLFGWVKSGTSWKPTNHVISPLSTAEPPKTAKGLRSWLGAFKPVTQCIPNYAVLIGPHEAAHVGKTSQEKVSWTTDMYNSFKEAKDSLKII